MWGVGMQRETSGDQGKKQAGLAMAVMALVPTGRATPIHESLQAWLETFQAGLETFQAELLCKIVAPPPSHTSKDLAGAGRAWNGGSQQILSQVAKHWTRVGAVF